MHTGGAAGLLCSATAPESCVFRAPRLQVFVGIPQLDVIYLSQQACELRIYLTAVVDPGVSCGTLRSRSSRFVGRFGVMRHDLMTISPVLTSVGMDPGTLNGTARIRVSRLDGPVVVGHPVTAMFLRQRDFMRDKDILLYGPRYCYLTTSGCARCQRLFSASQIGETGRPAPALPRFLHQ